MNINNTLITIGSGLALACMACNDGERNAKSSDVINQSTSAQKEINNIEMQRTEVFNKWVVDTLQKMPPIERSMGLMERVINRPHSDALVIFLRYRISVEAVERWPETSRPRQVLGFLKEEGEHVGVNQTMFLIEEYVYTPAYGENEINRELTYSIECLELADYESSVVFEIIRGRINNRIGRPSASSRCGGSIENQK